MGQDRTFCEHGFEAPEGILALRCAFEHLIFLSKICQWFADLTESFDKAPVEVGEAKECLYVFYIPWYWPVPY